MFSVTPSNLFKGSYYSGCILLAVSLSLWYCYLYYIDEDIQNHEITRDRIYPSLTLCFDSPISSKNNTLPKMGNMLKDSLFQLNSESNTLQIESYIDTIAIQDFENGVVLYKELSVIFDANYKRQARNLSLNTVLRRYKNTSCFAIGVPFLKDRGVKSMNIGIKKNMFKTANVPTISQLMLGNGQFSLALSYQNQIFPLSSEEHTNLETRLESSGCLRVDIVIKGIEVLRSRNKRSKFCNRNVDDTEREVLDNVMAGMGCRPPGWDVSTNSPDCDKNFLELKSTRNTLDDGMYQSNAKRLISPCGNILALWYDYSSAYFDCLSPQNEKFFYIKLAFNNGPVKEISDHAAFSILHLASKIGLIISVVFGFSLIQLPDLFKYIINSLQKKSESIECKENEDDRTDVMITEDEDQISTQDRKIQIITKKLELLQNKLHLIQLHRETSV